MYIRSKRILMLKYFDVNLYIYSILYIARRDQSLEMNGTTIVISYIKLTRKLIILMLN